MRGGIPVLDACETHRVRRWDAVVLGGALPGLIAAVRLGMRGSRVLVLEEQRAATAFPGLREPFLMAGGGEGVLGPCLEALGFPLIDRRSVHSELLAYQVVLPGARVNVGQLTWTADEFECWGLASREASHRLVSSLDARAAAHSARLLAAQAASPNQAGPRAMRRSGRRNARAAPAHAEPADPLELGAARAPRMNALLDAQVRALSDFADRPPGDATRHRLLGASLRGAADVVGRERWLRSLLRRRIEALYGEFRNLSGAFRIVSANQLPAIASDESPEICAARALIVNAPRSALCDTHYGQASEWLCGPNWTHRRLTLHMRGKRELLPLGMAPRVICVRDPSQPMRGTNVVRLRVFDDASSHGQVDVVASAVVPPNGSEQQHLERIGRSVSGLMPLGNDGWTRVPIAEPHWDTDALIGDADRGDAGLHQPVSRVPAYILDRWQTAGLGFEDDLMLGWNAGDSLATAL